MDKTKVILIGTAACVFLAAFTAGYYIISNMGEDTQYFGLSSTKITLLEDENYDMSVWSLPGNTAYSDIVWTSSDENVVTVVNGTFHAESLGTAIITASTSYNGEKYKDSCTVTVSSTKETMLVSYDAYSSDMDYSVLSGSGFTDGLLALTYNYYGCTVISLAGYDPSWLNLNSSFIGSAKVDFSKITMTVQKNGVIVAQNIYEGKTDSAGHNKSGYNWNTNPYSPLIVVKGLDYGTYTVTFKLEYGMFNSRTVSGTFEYCHGDGSRDASGQFVRTYSWRCDTDGLLSGQKSTRSITVEYDYSDYFNGYMKNSKSLKIYSNGVSNCGRSELSPRYVTQSDDVAALLEALEQDYTKAYGKTDYSTQHFAQYLLTFVEVEFEYEYDNTQYYKFEENYFDNTDYWAYSDETLFSGCGDCEDTSFVLASLYKAAGYDCALIELPGHMMTAVALEEFKDYTSKTQKAPICKATKDGESYYFCETTADAPVVQAAKSTVSGSATYTYSTSFITEKSDTALVTYSYGYCLVGNASKKYVGEEFTLISV